MGWSVTLSTSVPLSVVPGCARAGVEMAKTDTTAATDSAARRNDVEPDMMHLPTD
jgi:hypothetical protein